MSDERRFSSRYTDKKITPAQFIAEKLCENKALGEGKELPPRFWAKKEWAKYFAYQVTLANSYLKKYPVECIVKAIRVSKVYSLRNYKFKKEVDKAYSEFKLGGETTALNVVKNSVGDFRPKQTMLDKLDN